MPEQRIMGQDVIVTPFINDIPQQAITDVRNFEVAVQVEVVREGYLGQFTDRRDDIYRGIRGSYEIHFSSRAALDMVVSITNRARRVGANVQIITQAALVFPNGDSPIIVTTDCFFNEIPLAFGSRGDFGNIRFDWEADDFRVIG